MEEIDLAQKALEIRKKVIELIYNAKTGHTGGALSATDIMVTLYYHTLNVDVNEPNNPNRDRFILSKGHSVEPLWCILADKGFFPIEELQTFSQYKTRLIGHPNNKVPGIEMNTGSLGHGLSVSCGLALGAKKQGLDYRVFVLMGDGEQAEGSVWEAAMFAAHYKLDNIVAIIDRNNLQISGPTEEVMGLNPLSKKWEAFGWDVIEVNGHNHFKLSDVFDEANTTINKPKMIIANTIKGKGISYVENKAVWHHKVFTEEQYGIAIEELNMKPEEECNE